jgi:hypothetical protein
MSTNIPRAMRSQSAIDEARHRMDAEMTLAAIAGAIAMGRLPPDDAFAWARIAVHEARRLADFSSANQ